MTKVCPQCRLELPLEDFNKRAGNKKSGRQSWCRECMKSRLNADYRDPENSRKASIRSNNMRAQIRNLDFVLEYLRNHPCVDCGEKDPIVLEFDHVRGIKLFTISRGCRQGMGINKLRTEIEKCDVRCANCHRRATATRGGWRDKLLFGSSD